MTDQRCLITGASRGIGLEFCRQWLADGRTVFALARDPEASEGLKQLQTEFGDRLKPVPCDVRDDESVASAVEQVAGATDGIDILVNNAAIYGRQKAGIDELRIDKIDLVFQTNVLGALRIAKSFAPLLRAGRSPRLANITSLMGSIEDNSSGGSYAYRLSKSALNMATRNLAHDFAEDGITAVVLHPGWVQTDMGGQYAPLSVTESVAAMAGTIDRLTTESSGSFFDRNGDPLPW